MGKRGSILVCDDEEIVRDVLERILSSAGYKVNLAKTGEESLKEYIRKPYDVVLMDISMHGISGLTTLEELIKIDQQAVVLMITGYATYDAAVSAWEKGADSIIRKPFQNEQILEMVARGVKKRHSQEARVLIEPKTQASSYENFIGRSNTTEDIYRLIERVALARTPILITGESEPGKELIAKTIHESSQRAENPFVTVNCLNTSPELLESKLFGQAKDAFTNSEVSKKGLFESANGGSIFLNEVGNLRPEAQSRLLRLIQEREIIQIGDSSPLKIDVRIIAATQFDLKKAVQEGTFRKDLYYRLSVVAFEFPPLRECREHILPLAQYFIRKYNLENGREISEKISPEIFSLLENYHYPGNVYELENIIERAVITTSTDEITIECLRFDAYNPESLQEVVKDDENFSMNIGMSHGLDFYDAVKNFEMELIRRALKQADGHQSRAAKLLNLNPTTLNTKIQKLQ